MIRIFQGLSSLQNVRQLLKRSCLENKLPPSISTSLTFQKAQSLYCQISEMYKLQPNKAQNEWLENEVKLFHWILICHSLYSQKLIENFDENDWLAIQKYFPSKPLVSLEHEYKKLLLKNDKESYCLWNDQQKQKLIKIISQKQQPLSWEDISRSLYLLSDKKFFKTSKQCREQWFNHLDPTKKHGEWKIEEDIQIVRFALKNGHKWSLLCKNTFPHRTQHMVKNRFNSILRKYKDGQMYLAANERKILKRIVKKLEEETLQPHPNENKKGQVYQHVLPLKVTQNQIEPNKTRNSIIDKNVINVPHFPFFYPFSGEFLQNPNFIHAPNNSLQNSTQCEKSANNNGLGQMPLFGQNNIQQPSIMYSNQYLIPNLYWFGPRS